MRSLSVSGNACTVRCDHSAIRWSRPAVPRNDSTVPGDDSTAPGDPSLARMDADLRAKQPFHGTAQRSHGTAHSFPGAGQSFHGTVGWLHGTVQPSLGTMERPKYADFWPKTAVLAIQHTAQPPLSHETALLGHDQPHHGDAILLGRPEPVNDNYNFPSATIKMTPI